MIHRLMRLASVATVLVATSADAKGPYGSIRVGLWTGGTYTNNSTDKFSHCAAFAPYLSGVVLFVFMEASNSWALGFSHESWELKIGEAFPITLTFDAQAPIQVFGRGVTRNLVQVSMPSNSAVMSQFRKASMMSAFAQGQLYQFKLDGTSQLLPTLANCVASVKSKGIGNVGDFTVTQVAKPAAVAPPGDRRKPQGR